MSLWGFVNNFWSSMVSVFWNGPSTIYQDTVGNLQTWLGNVVLSAVESFAEDAIAALLTILATVLNSILSFYNSILQYGVIGMSSLGLLGSVFAIVMLMGTFLGLLTAVKVLIRLIP